MRLSINALGMLLSLNLQSICMTKKSGRGPPTAPTLRPRVLTPRDHFVHRGGERKRIMQ